MLLIYGMENGLKGKMVRVINIDFNDKEKIIFWKLSY